MLSRLYGKITDFRNTLYEKEVLKSFSLGAKTVSIGNITVGGTGKTPLVAFVARNLAKSGEKVCILTRGYGRENPKKRVLVSDGETILAAVKQAGDEPLELARKLLGAAIVVADANRVAAAKWAREKFGATVFVLDDAFQHRKAKRDLDVVILDGTNPFGNFKILPAGILRESLSELKRADLIVISRANLAENAEKTKRKIREYNPRCPIFTSENRISELIELKKFNAETQMRENAMKKSNFHLNFNENELPVNSENSEIRNYEIKDKKALAFCALGNPNNFFEMLRRENFNLIATEIFPDHHFYSRKDIEKLEKTAASTGAEILLTTAKDGVKLKDLQFDASCFVVETELFFDDQENFLKVLRSI
ncbi:MAG TPA: tetraacyldisaccharide 4'-kinase [Pyrinomonadaceae bacterium]|jgi:tetraacyldisaccharide 4'-kinase